MANIYTEEEYEQLLKEYESISRRFVEIRKERDEYKQQVKMLQMQINGLRWSHGESQ